MNMQLTTKKLTDIHPYERNPRVNDQAVDAVIESIKQCSYIAPIIVDEDGVILAGHTRYKALKKLNVKEAEVIVRAGLTEEQKRKYRLLDNKTGELAEWDVELLLGELGDLDFGDLELDWDLDMDFADDGGRSKETHGAPGKSKKEKPGNFSKSKFKYTQQYGVTVILGSEVEQEACYNKLRDMGYDCRVVTV